jgi:molybdopterin/thiamine biosynthesis adenylyltransferase
MDKLEARHSGTLDGRLLPMDQAARVTVAISITRDVATLPACQHTIWMLVNLLARQVGIVDQIYVEIPDEVPLGHRIVPLADRDLDLSTAVGNGASAIGGVPVTISSTMTALPKSTIRFEVGPGVAAPGAWRVHGENWWGGLSNAAIPGDGSSPLPLGPYVAASLAASEVFKSVRIENYARLISVFFSVWTLTVSEFPELAGEWAGPNSVDDTQINVVLAGVGAVGSTWMHVIWATPGLSGTVVLADADTKGVDNSNLNRCPIFGRSSIGKPKSSEAARICADADVTLVPHDGTATSTGHRPDLLVSAVDTNLSRRSVQGIYPARILSGSTNGLHAEVLRCDPNAPTACLHCYNPVDADGPTDAETRRTFLNADPHERQSFLRTLGLNLNMDEAMKWAIEGSCGHVGDRIASHLRSGASNPGAFAVGFVSVMTGVMLAALALQESLGKRTLSGLTCRAVFLFLDPLNPVVNSPKDYARDSTCSMCDPSSQAAIIWKNRYNSF